MYKTIGNNHAETFKTNDMKLEEQLRKHYKSESGMGYRSFGMIQLRIKDHSCNYKNNTSPTFSVVCESDDTTSSKFVSENTNVSEMTFEEACIVIDLGLLNLAKEEILNSDNCYDKASTIIDLFDKGIINEYQAKDIFDIANIIDENQIEEIENQILSLID